jgi:glycosyltransferase involved in cell wall biosynthesis
MLKKRPKILFILHFPPPVHGSSMVGKFIKESTSINQAFDCHYINLGTSGSIDEIGKGGITKLFRYISILGKTISKLILSRPELCYLAITAQGVGFYKDSFVALILRFFKVPMVYHFHNKGVRKRQDKKIDNLLYKLVFNNSDAILLSKYLYPDISKYFPEDRVYFCPNGIPSAKRVRPQTIASTNSDKPPTILFFSNLIESKGVFDLLVACKMLKSKGLSFKCTYIGGTADIDEHAFRVKVNELGLEEHVDYAGRKIGDEKEESFLEADIFAFPTYYPNECFPLVLLEAMQFSLPVVSTIEGGIQDIVETGKSGFLIRQRDTMELSKHLENMLQNPGLRNQMGQAGRKRYEERFTLEKFEENLKNILTEILTNNNSK